MSLDITKKQHYVWREYLRAWSTNEQIDTFFVLQNKIQKTNLENVVQKRYFYKFHLLNEIEIGFLDYIVEKAPNPVKLNMKQIMDFQKIYNCTKEFSAKIKYVNTSILDSLEKNGFEALHSRIELDGLRLIECRNLEDLQMFDNIQFKHEALMYLCFQYFRTKNRKDEIIKTFKGKESNVDFDKIFSILSIFFSLMVAQKLAFDNRISYHLLVNDTDTFFITGNQPIINLRGGTKDENGEVMELEFYYPLSPRCALKIEFKGKEQYLKYNPSIEEIEMLNSKILDESKEFVFSSCELMLKSIQLAV